jgi:hypothetical protein
LLIKGLKKFKSFNIVSLRLKEKQIARQLAVKRTAMSRSGNVGVIPGEQTDENYENNK